MHHKSYKDSILNRIAAAKVSALAVAAPLSDDTLPNGSTRPRTAGLETKTIPEKKKTPNQKLELLIALLSVGAVRHSVAVMTQFPWMAAAYPDVVDLFIRILRVSIQPLYEKLCRPNIEFTQSNTTPRSKYGTNGVIVPPPRKLAVTLIAPVPPNTSTTEFVFFYPHWQNAIPLCTDLSDIGDVLMPLLKFIGVQVSRDIGFVTKLCRLGKIQLTSPVCFLNENNKTYFFTFTFLTFRMYLTELKLFGLKSRENSCYPQFLSNVPMLCAQWNLGWALSVILMWRLGGRCMGNGNKAFIKRFRNFESPLLKLIERLKVFFAGFRLRIFLKCPGTLQSFAIPIPALYWVISSSKLNPMKIWRLL